MKKYLVVQTNVPPTGARPIEREVLCSDPEVDFALRGFCGSDQQLIDALQDADVALCGREYFTREVFASTPRLKGVVRYGVGVETIDLEAATEYGVTIAYFPDFCTAEVANHTLAMVLACAKKLLQLDQALRHEGWYEAHAYRSPMGPIHGETLGIVAFGAIAQAVARRAQAFDMNVIAYDPYARDEVFTRTGVERVSIDELAKRSDYVACLAPMSEANRGFLGEAFFSQMKPTAYFINTSRGGVVHEAALIAALKERRIAGAGLDVFENEPIRGSHALFDMPNVILTPHTAAWADATFAVLYQRVARAALDLIHGRRPEYVANPTVLK